MVRNSFGCFRGALGRGVSMPNTNFTKLYACSISNCYTYRAKSKGRGHVMVWQGIVEVMGGWQFSWQFSLITNGTYLIARLTQPIGDAGEKIFKLNHFYAPSNCRGNFFLSFPLKGLIMVTPKPLGTPCLAGKNKNDRKALIGEYLKK